MVRRPHAKNSRKMTTRAWCTLGSPIPDVCNNTMLLQYLFGFCCTNGYKLAFNNTQFEAPIMVWLTMSSGMLQHVTWVYSSQSFKWSSASIVRVKNPNNTQQHSITSHKTWMVLLSTVNVARLNQIKTSHRCQLWLVQKPITVAVHNLLHQQINKHSFLIYVKMPNKWTNKFFRS